MVITFHSMGDRDSIGSAVALGEYLSQSVIVTPDFITSNARRMLKEIEYNGEITNVLPEDIDGLIVLDTNRSEHLGRFEPLINDPKYEKLFIDHHLLFNDEQLGGARIFDDESYNSTASIIYAFLKHVSHSLSKVSALALLNGIVSDSAEFQNATSLTFMQISELLDIAKIDYATVNEFFHERIPIQNRLSIINTLYNSRVELAGNYIMIYGKASLHANIAADYAIKLGADFSMFWEVNEEKVSISVRLREPLDRRFGIHLGKVMHDVAYLMDGTGGGHPAAAGGYGPNTKNIDKITKIIADKVREKFEGK
ncbi:MAG: DHH family phosphoesterase [Candidatus Micrarchaeia archaeon]